MDIQLDGIWEGYYRYGNGYDLPFFDQKVHFTVTFKSEGEGFKGESFEEQNQYSVNAIGSIEGYVDFEMISFVKEYPNRYVTDGGHIVIDKDNARPYAIEHIGFLDSKYQSMYGKWLIADTYIDENGKAYEEHLEGTWILKKQ